MYFADRYDAAMQLASLLEKYRGAEGVILAVPRGGVPIGYFLAKHLGLPLDLLMTKKLGHPDNPEFAIGAVGLEDSIVEETRGVDQQYVQAAIENTRKQLQEKYKLFMGGKLPVNLMNKVVIVVDDGIATGRTILATVRMLRKQRPAKLVVAVPVASREAAARIREVVDDFVCVHKPFPFFGVGRFYGDFSQVTDEEVQLLLRELNERGGKAA